MNTLTITYHYIKISFIGYFRSHNKGAAAERPFRCDLCEKDFMCKGHLVSHRRSHSGERPFSCPDCGRSFVEKGNMLRHLRKHATDNGHNATVNNPVQNVNSQVNNNQASQPQQQTSTSTVQVTQPQVSQAQTMTSVVSSGNIVPHTQHMPLHPQTNHPVVVPTANGNVLASY